MIFKTGLTLSSILGIIASGSSRQDGIDKWEKNEDINKVVQIPFVVDITPVPITVTGPGVANISSAAAITSVSDQSTYS